MTSTNDSANNGAVGRLSRREVLQGTAGAGVLSLVSGTGASAEGTTELVVRAEQVDVPLAAETSVVDELKAEAEESQAPIVDYVERTDGLSVKNQFWISNSLLLAVDTDEVDPDELAAQKGVSQVHPNYEMAIPDPETGNASAEATDVTYGLDQLDVPEAWDQFDARGQGATVAVLDTGVDPNHPDIDIDAGNFAEFDGDGNEVDSEPHDSAYHGTHVSGTATGGDDSGTAIGVAPEAELLHGLILPGGSGSFTQIIAGIQWAVEQDADVINMSLGATGYNSQLIEPVRNAEAAGTTVVAAAGNDGEGTTGSPGNVVESFAAGASNEDEGIASFSGGETIDTQSAWGDNAPDEWPDSYVVPDAAAPGVDVTSSYPVDHSEGPYNAISGTSMASPHLTGVVGLMESAGAEDVTPEQAKNALENTAWKPEGEPDEPDVRYGHGIVDAVTAIGRVAADAGVEGTITDADGKPIEGASVELDGFPTETDENGEYRLRAASGTYELSVDAFGHDGETVTVDVGEAFVTRDFTLGDDLAVTPVTEQPDGLEAGESFDVEVRAANAETITVDRVGTYGGDASLSVNGEEAAFGEAFSFGRATSGVVTLTVDTSQDGSGDLDLEVTLDGLGETVTVATGSTSVYADSVSVGIVDDTGAYGADVESMLGGELHPRYNLSTLDAPTAVSAAEDREHDAYVAVDLGTDEDVVTAFADVATAPDVGVVYLDQYGTGTDSIYQSSDIIGNPSDVTEAYVQLEAPPVNYTVDRDHPVLDDVADPGDSVTVNEPDPVDSGFFYFGGFHAYFDDYQGPVSSSTLAGTALGSSDTGDAGLAVDDLSRVALASSLGVGSYVGSDVFTAEGRALLANLVEHAVQTPPVEVVSTPAEKIAPGDSATLELDGSNLVEMEFGVSGLRYVEESDLTLTVNGETVPFGEPITYDEPYDGSVEATVRTPAGAVGEFAFDARFVSVDDGNHEIATSVTLDPTTVYESPLSVPDDLDDLQAAVDFVTAGDEVVVGGGTYEVASDRGSDSGLYVGTGGVTIRGVEGETVEIVHAEDVASPSVVNVDADGVTLENLSANVLDGEIDPKNDVGFGVHVNALVSGTTIRNVTAAGTNGVLLDENVSDVTVENVTVVDSGIGVGTDISGGGPVSNATITGLAFDRPDDDGYGGVYVENGDQVTVTESQIVYGEGFDAGILLWGDFDASDDNRIARNTISGPDADDPSGDGDAGIFVDEANAEIEANQVAHAHLGIRVGDYGFGERDVVVRDNTVANAATGFFQTGDYVSLENNTVDAETGLDIDGGYSGLDADAVVARYNDLSSTDVPFVGDPADGDSAPEGPFDVRLNYLGGRAYDDTIADGEFAYDPFLTARPAEVDRSETTRIATDLYLDAGTTYGLGVPGGTDRTIYEILGVDDFREFAGTMEYWHAKSGKWKKIRGQGRNKRVGTLDGFRVTPSEGVRAVVDFREREGVPPGHHESDPGTTTLEPGWNVVAAPQFGDPSEVFGDAVAQVDDSLASPAGQLGDGEVRAFTAYRVEASESTELSAGLDAYGPTMTELYESLGLDPVIHETVGPREKSTGKAPSVAAVLDAASDDEAADAVASLVGHRIGQRLAAADDVAATADEIAAVATAVLDEAPSSRRDLVEEAVLDVADLAFRSAFGALNVAAEDAEYDTDVAKDDAENGGTAASSLNPLGSVLSD
ncbi:S8 family serine peptidase [Halorussus halobius]|uniref:S8 family serine peptidase n=1 Tax=Halorussus halobius TaxID=1710537 RepID=UPI00143CDC8F|nr:S8 family serine peptidase [Halorussus halobius]